MGKTPSRHVPGKHLLFQREMPKLVPLQWVEISCCAGPGKWPDLAHVTLSARPQPSDLCPKPKGRWLKESARELKIVQRPTFADSFRPKLPKASLFLGEVPHDVDSNIICKLASLTLLKLSIFNMFDHAEGFRRRVPSIWPGFLLLQGVARRVGNCKAAQQQVL